jgi:hypothetical protein
MLHKKKVEKTKMILNIDRAEKDAFKKICEENELSMSEVLVYTIRKINEKGEFDSVDFRAE